MQHIDAQAADRNSKQFPLGAVIAEGKTKIIRGVTGNTELSIVINKDDITANNGEMHDVISHKARWATETTCNVFELLKANGLPIAYVQRDNVNSFIARLCTMLPYEIVVRREAHGTYLKRHPMSTKGMRFHEPIVEFCLKTKDKEWKGEPLQCDDPLMIYDETFGDILLYELAKPFNESEPFARLSRYNVWVVQDEHRFYEMMAELALQAFLILEAAWAREGVALVDLKVEFGLDSGGTLLLADVIDNDSWRLVKDGTYLDKQIYRDGGPLTTVAKLYEYVAEVTQGFDAA